MRLDRYHWTIAGFGQPMTQEEWTELASYISNLIWFKEKLYPLIAKDIGRGRVEVWKDLSDPLDPSLEDTIEEKEMSYKESELRCDWCNSYIDNGGDVACRDCMQDLEQEIENLKTEIEHLKQIIFELESRNEELESRLNDKQ